MTRDPFDVLNKTIRADLMTFVPNAGAGSPTPSIRNGKEMPASILDILKILRLGYVRFEFNILSQSSQ